MGAVGTVGGWRRAGVVLAALAGGLGAADAGMPGASGAVRLIAGPAGYTVDERMQTTAPAAAAVQAVSALDPERTDGWVYGGELGVGRTGWERTGENVALRTVSLDALFGYAGRIAGGLRWEATPLVGMGLARWQVTDQAVVSAPVRALYLEAGARAGLSWTSAAGVQVAVEARGTAGRSQAWLTREDYAGATSTVHDHARIYGWAVLGGLGWSF